MILGLFVGVVLLSAALAITWLSYMYQRRPDGVPQWPAPAPALPQHRDFAGELAAIGEPPVPPAAPDYMAGEYPQVEPVEAEPVDEPAAAEQVGPYRSRHAADEDLAEPEVKPWQRPTLHTEPTPFFSATGAYPVFDLDLLSATGAWGTADRAALQALLDMDEGAAA